MGLMDRDYWKERHRDSAPSARTRKTIEQLQRGIDSSSSKTSIRTTAVVWVLVIVGLYCLLALVRR